MADKVIKEIEITPRLTLVQFEDAAQPVFVEKKGKPYIFYGEKNDYPQYLLYLYNNSAKHNGIINGKVNYIIGKGWTFDKSLGDDPKIKAFIDKANAEGESLKAISEKCALDMEIFNGAYLQIEWGKNGEVVDIYHVDYSQVRSNKDNTIFFVAEDWVTIKPDGSYQINSRPKYTEYPTYNLKKRRGTQILYIKKYHPGINTYTLPTYRGSITWIEIDIEIGSYHLSNVKSGFFANKLINFNNGVPPEEKQEEIEKGFKKKFSGAKGQKFIISYNDNADRAASVEDLNISESDKIFDLLNKTSQQEILTGHNVVSPMLFGIKSEGQLGGNNEVRTAYEIFQNTYVNSKQQWLEEVFNAILHQKGIPTDRIITIQRTEPVAYQFSEATQGRVMTEDEIREKMGLPPRSNTPAGPGQFSSADDERDAEVFADFGSKRREFDIVKSSNVMFIDSDAEQQHFATTIDALSVLQQQILAILKKDPLTTQKVLADALDETLDMVNSAIHDLVYNNLLEVNKIEKEGGTIIQRLPVKDADTIIKNIEPENRSIQVMYSYEGPKDKRNRAFCKRLLELNRLYSRADIEKISTKLDYSVWARRGGWYTLPGTNTHRPFCRHAWKSNVVVKRKS